MSSLFVFNPETDIVLGLDADTYTPNKKIVNFRKRLSLLPALYAEKGDSVLILDKIDDEELSSLPFFEIAEAKGMRIFKPELLKKISWSANDSDSGPYHLNPWGWNKEIIKKMSSLKRAIDFSDIESNIEKIRSLSSRRMTIQFFNKFYSGNHFRAPSYFTDIREIERFISSHTSVCLKAPWSSSGRGVIFSHNTQDNKIIEWANGIIKSQGGVMVEEFYHRKIDFASEWSIEDGEIKYCGLSLFKADSKGNYLGNHLIPRNDIQNILKECSDWSDSFLSMQKDYIEKNIFPYYRGPLGFDMLVREDGRVNPCVEINLRRTMGHVSIEIEKQISDFRNPELASLFKRTFPNGIFSVMDFV